MEFKECKKEQSRINYHTKNDDVPKMKRGRKKKEIDPDEPPKVIRPRGRPKFTKTLVEAPIQARTHFYIIMFFDFLFSIVYNRTEEEQ